jgi:tRNA pseudouridine13 synthase
MRFKVQPEDFWVEEQIRLSLLPRGSFSVYRVHKRGVTTMGVQAQIARAIGVPQSDVVFPALKDKKAVVVQHAAVRGTGPARLSGKGFRAEFLGRSLHPLSPADVSGNRFTLVLRDLSDQEVVHIQERLLEVSRFGLPNYFDQQRFGSLAPGEDHVGKRILCRDAESALRAYLTQPFVGDPGRVREFKAFAAQHWGDWEAMFEAAPRPSNYRSVLTYLRDHPQPTDIEYRKALNLITRRLLSIYLAAYQSLLWNRIAARYLEVHLSGAVESPYVEIGGERLPTYHELPRDWDRERVIPLPNHRAAYGEPSLGELVTQVLDREGLALNDLKARILKRAYLAKGKRTLLLFPEGLSASGPEPDERYNNRTKLTLDFSLPRGSYATLVVKILAL